MISAIVIVHGAEPAPSADQAKPLSIGTAAPRVTLPAADGRAVELVAGQPTVLIFYRGGLCPYCNTHLSDVQKIEKDLVALGYRILAVSPESIEASKATAEKDALAYTLLSDHDMEASAAYGVAYRVDDATVEKYKNFGIKLTTGRDGHPWMPVPSVFIVGRDGKIGFVHAEVDYKKRISSADLLQAAQKLSGR